MAKKRKKRRRRDRGRLGALYKLVLVVLVPVCIIAGCVIFFRVGEIQVSGMQKYTAEEVIKASGAEQGENLLFLNRQAIERQVMTQLPYVEEVTVIRHFPDTLEISVSESVPVAAIEADGSWWLLNENCKLLEKVEQSAGEGCLSITGLTALAPSAGVAMVVEEQERTKLEALKNLMAALSERDMLSDVTYIDLSSDYLIVMGYTEFFQVEMPLASDFDYMIRRLEASSSNEKILENTYYTVDMTIEGEIHYIPK